MGFTAAIPAELGDIIGGFTQLFQPGGNLGDLISGILHGAPLFGVFLIVMMLVSFSLRISLMKNAEHKSYATWIGVGSGLIVIINEKVYAFIRAAFGEWLLYALGGIALFYVIYALLHKGTTGFYKDKASTRRAQVESSQAKRDLSKEQQETNLSEAVLDKEKRAVQGSKTFLGNYIQGFKSLKSSIKNLRELLQTAADIQSKGENADTYRKGILSRVAIIVTELKQEFKGMEKIRTLSQAEAKLEFKELDLAKTEDVLFNDFEKTMHVRMNLKAGKGPTSPRNPQMQAAWKSLENQFRGQIQAAHALLETKKKLIEEAKTYESKELDQIQTSEQIASSMAQHAQSGDFAGALKTLATIESQISAVEKESKAITELLSREEAIVIKVTNIDKELKKLSTNMLRKIPRP